MALPRKLKQFNLFGDGRSWLGLIEEVQLPKLERKIEEYRGGGMNGPVAIDMGQEKIELEFTAGGMMQDILIRYAESRIDAVLLRFAGSYQRDDTGQVDAVEVICRGRYNELDPGKAKAGDNTDFKAKLACSYYKLSINGSVIIEIDVVNFIEIVNGVDRLAEHRAAIGM